ncbi:MAG: TonB-dependent receptor [Pseudarcicella sp.]|nr:TonB-dependent receptor [Pseudarcicella sp.]
MTKNLLFFTLLLGFFSQTHAQSIQKITISGYVKEKNSGELLPGVNASIKEKKIGNQTNKYGFFSLTFNPEGENTITFSFVGYKTTYQIISGKQSQEITVELEPENNLLDEVVIKGNSPNGSKQKISENVQMSQLSIPVAQIKEIPAFLGERDVLKVIQLMPGVQKGSEGNSGIYVRGGGPDQNILILDDAPVYNAYHLFGFFSVFNGDALKSVELTKGGFPARYGGRLSSVIEMQMKDGNKSKLHGEGGIGLISSRLMLEGPLSKNHKSSFLISGRRTYLDVIAKPFIEKESSESGGYYFYDLNAKFNYVFDSKNKLYLSGYFGKDKFYATDERNGNSSNNGLKWGNATATLRWNHLYNNQIFSNTSLIYSNYIFDIISEETFSNSKDNRYLKYFSSIRDFTLKQDFDYLPSNKHSLKFGGQFTNHYFTPSAIVLKDNAFSLDKNVVRPINTWESALYIEDTYKPFEKLQVNAGLRLTHFYTKDDINQLNLEPRLALAYILPKNWAIKGSYANMNQYIHLLSNSGGGLPTDLWVPANNNVKPQRSWQIATGVAKDFTQNNLELSIEAYYKELKNIVSYKEGASFLLGGDESFEELINNQSTEWDKLVTQGKGKSYGAELMLQRKVGKFTGWIGYTLSYTKQQFDELNFGKEFYARYDRRHDASVVAIYKISPKIILSGTWVYGTGNAINLPSSTFKPLLPLLNLPSNLVFHSNNIGKVNEYKERNSFRAEDYHRLDFSIQFIKKMKRGHERTWVWSIYNVYNQKNPFFYQIKDRFIENSSQSEKYLSKLSLFGIIPSVSYNFKF